jgi:Holliday junction resolvase RusA-like endonuclease
LSRTDGQGKGLFKYSGGTSAMFKCEISTKLPSLNDYIRECRGNKYRAAKFKNEIENEIALYINRLPSFDKPIKIYFEWYEKDRRRDLDNVAFAKKFVLDAMVKCGKIKDDNRKCVVGFQDSFFYADKNKVIIYIIEVNKNDA